jgi:hypothetical protein
MTADDATQPAALDTSETCTPGPRAPDADVVLLLEVDPHDLAAWLPSVESGARVVLPGALGSLPAVREAVAVGVVRLVGTPTDADEVASTSAQLAALEVSDADHQAVCRVLRHRLDTGAAGATDLRTSPRVLLAALTGHGLGRAATTQQLLEQWGCVTTVLTSTGFAGRTRTGPLATTTVVTVPDPAHHWFPARAERAVARRLPTKVARWVNDPWGRVMKRIHPALVARRALPALAAAGLDLADLDLLWAPGAECQTLVWRLLRDHPDLVDHGTITSLTVGAAVRRRTLALAQTLG